MRILIEILHVLAGLLSAALIAEAASWAVPLARHDVWQVTYAAMVLIVAMAVPMLRKAWQDDRQRRFDDFAPMARRAD